MSKDPAFLFYYQDFMWGTRFFTREQRGLFIEFMCEQADSSTGSISEEHMNNICNSCDEHTKNMVLSKFKKDVDWKPEYTFEQTMQDLLDWWRKNV